MDNETPTPPPMDEQPDESSSDDTPRRSGRARERYERRRQQHATPRTAAAPRQINVPKQFTMPAIRLPRSNRFLFGAFGAVLFVAIIVFALGRLRNAEPEAHPNALWLGTEWTYDVRTDEDVTALVKRLRDQQIGTVYAYVTYLQFNGTWRNEDKFEQVKAFVQQFKQAYPEAKIEGWVGVPVQDATHPARLGDVDLQQQVADLAQRLVTEFGFDGIFLNAEIVWDGDQDFLALLRKIRAAVGIDVPISAAIPPDWSPSNSSIPLPPLMTPGTEWKKEYKQSVALLVDHMAIMAYQSSLSTPSDYAQWVAYQVKTYALAVAELNVPTDLIIGIPTYDAEPPGHDPAVENITSAVEGIRLGLGQAGDAARYVSGLAIYADWTTDETEWANFQTAWVQSP